jgi:hypothetical protein
LPGARTARPQRIADILYASRRSPLKLRKGSIWKIIRAARSGGQDVRDPFCITSPLPLVCQLVEKTSHSKPIYLTRNRSLITKSL